MTDPRFREIVFISLSVGLLAFLLSSQAIAQLAEPSLSRPLRIVCSNPSSGFLEVVAAGYREMGHDINFEIQQIHNEQMMRQMGMGYAEMAVHSGPLDIFDLKTLKKFFPHHGKFEEWPVAQFTVAVVAHPRLGIKSLTVDQIARICTGKLTNCEELGGSRRDIVLVGQSLRFNSANILRRVAFPDQPLSAKLVEKTTKSEVINTVKKTPGAIGFFLHDWKETGGLRPLPIAPRRGVEGQGSESVELSKLAVIARRYPLTDELIVVYHPNASREVYEFIEYLKTEAVADVAIERKLLTEYHRREILGDQRLVDLKAGKGTIVRITGLALGENLAQKLALKYVEARELVQVRYRERTSPADAVKEFQRGGTELLFVDGNAGDRDAQLKESARELTLGKSALGIIAHSERKLPSISLVELRQICAGEVVNWPAAEGEGPPIRAYALNDSHPVMEIYREQLAGKKHSARGVAGLLLHSQKDNQAVIQSVVQNPAGIGFVDLSQLPPLDGSVVLVGVIEGDKVYQPAPGQVPDGYPLVKPYTLYVSPTAGQAARNFADWLEKNPCQDVLARHHLLPPNGIQDSKTLELIASDSISAPVDGKTELVSAESKSVGEAPEGAPPEPAPTQSEATATDDVNEPLALAAVQSPPPGSQSSAAAVDALTSTGDAETNSADTEPPTLSEEVTAADSADSNWSAYTIIAVISIVVLLLGVAARIQWLRVRRRRWTEGNPLTLAE